MLFLHRKTRWLAALTGVAIYFALAWWLTLTYVDPSPKGRVVVQLAKPFETFADSHLVVSHSSSFHEFADCEGDNNRSPVLLYEDDRLLGPAHSSHRDIATVGAGRYSHWSSQGFVLSTSDNSNPNINGRRYWAVIPE